MSIARKIFYITAGFILSLIIIAFFLFIVPFIGNREPQDGISLAGGRVVSILDSISTVYLLDGGNGMAGLVDAGYSPGGAKIMAALRSRGLSPSDIKAIFLTHGHPDHIAAVKCFPGATIYALADEVPIVEGKRLNASPVSMFFSAVSTGIKVDKPLHDGDTVELGSLRVKIFAVPGHTGGSAVYLVNGVLFMGDAAFARTGGGIKGAMWIFSDDVGQNDRSLRSLAERLKPLADEIKTMAFAHTATLDGSGPLFDYTRTIR